MAKTTNALQSAKQQLADQQAAAQGIERKIEALTRQAAPPPVGADPAADLAAIHAAVQATGELDIQRRALAMLSARIESQKGRIATLEAEATAADLVRLRRDEAEALAAVVKGTLALIDLCATLDTVQRGIFTAGGGHTLIGAHSLYQAAIAQVTYWKAQKPELLGLPPKPSRAEELRADWQRQLAHVEECVRLAEALPFGPEKDAIVRRNKSALADLRKQAAAALG